MYQKSEQMFEKMNITPMGFSVLRYLALSPDREYYLRELAKNVGCSVGGCHKVLKSLHEMGLVVRRVSGRNLYYSINDENPAVRHFKIFGNILELKEVVDGIKSSSKKILLFGSCANGSDTLDSDIDLLVLTENPDMLRKTLRKIQMGRPIKAIVLTAGEFIKLRERVLCCTNSFISHGAIPLPIYNQATERDAPWLRNK